VTVRATLSRSARASCRPWCVEIWKEDGSFDLLVFEVLRCVRRWIGESNTTGLLQAGVSGILDQTDGSTVQLQYVREVAKKARTMALGCGKW
jgi:hypothetical protein